MLMQMDDCMCKNMQINVQADVQIISHYCVQLPFVNTQLHILYTDTFASFVFLVCTLYNLCKDWSLSHSARGSFNLPVHVGSLRKLSAWRGKHYGPPLESSISPEDKC